MDGEPEVQGAALARLGDGERLIAQMCAARWPLAYEALVLDGETPATVAAAVGLEPTALLAQLMRWATAEMAAGRMPGNTLGELSEIAAAAAWGATDARVRAVLDVAVGGDSARAHPALPG